MSGVLRTGQHVNVPDVEGSWVVWSPAGGYGPGAYFLTPEGGGRGHLVVRAVERRNAVELEVTLLNDGRPRS